MSIAKDIQDSIKTIVNEAIRIAPFDKTRTGVVLDIDVEQNTYKVQIDGVVYNNLKATSGFKINVGDMVLVKFPTNNKSQMVISSVITNKINNVIGYNLIAMEGICGDNLFLDMDYSNIDPTTGHAQAGADMDLYNALVDLGWTNDVLISNNITLDQSSIIVTQNSTETLMATTVPLGLDVQWTSADKTIATVSATGMVTGVGVGATTIFASVNIGGSIQTVSCSVTVSNIPIINADLSYHGSWIYSGTQVDGYDVYQSNGSYNVSNGWDTMRVTFTNADNFNLYIRSYGESNYDYILVSTLNDDYLAQCTTTSAMRSVYNNTTYTKAYTRGKSSATNYELVQFTDLDPTQEYYFYIIYQKDGSGNSNDDRGYVYVPYNL